MEVKWATYDQKSNKCCVTGFKSNSIVILCVSTHREISNLRGKCQLLTKSYLVKKGITEGKYDKTTGKIDLILIFFYIRKSWIIDRSMQHWDQPVRLTLASIYYHFHYISLNKLSYSWTKLSLREDGTFPNFGIVP